MNAARFASEHNTPEPGFTVTDSGEALIASNKPTESTATTKGIQKPFQASPQSDKRRKSTDFDLNDRTQPPQAVEEAPEQEEYSESGSVRLENYGVEANSMGMVTALREAPAAS
jgi:hypothetical protein